MLTCSLTKGVEEGEEDDRSCCCVSDSTGAAKFDSCVEWEPVAHPVMARKSSKEVTAPLPDG